MGEKELIFKNIEKYCQENHNFKFNPKDPVVRLH